MENDIPILVIVFLAAFLMVLALHQAFRRRRPAEVTDDQLVRSRLGFLTLLMPRNNPFEELGMGLARQLFPSLPRELRLRIGIAGMSDILSEERLIGAQGFAGVASSLLAACLTLILTMDLRFTLVAGIFAGSVGALYPSMWLKRRALERQDMVSKELPFAMDLLTVAIQSGQDFGAALRLLLDEGHRSPLHDEFRQVMEDIQLGKTRIQSLQDMAARLDLEELRNLVAVVSQSIEMGAGLGDVFQLQASEMRRKRFHVAERKAARAPSLMIIPTALFILPATFIIILVPIVIKLLMTVKTT